MPMSEPEEIVGVQTILGPTIMLNSGAIVDLLDPASSQFTLDDIAHGLANLCRYSGQCSEFYSVAEHSILVSEVAEQHALEALLHDAAEAFLGDITRPLKQLLPDFKIIENRIQSVIMLRFGLSAQIPLEVKKADLQVLAAEQAQIMPPGLNSWAQAANIIPASIQVSCWTPHVAKAKFLERFHTLSAPLGAK
jgi:uncharacterized protein